MSTRTSPSSPSQASPLLSVENLSVVFNPGAKKGPNQEIQALSDISFELVEGEVLGVVGESGCGKSTLARAILQLQAITSGQGFWQGEDLTKNTNDQNKTMREHIQLIFQDPLDALNPRMTVAQIIAEPLYNLKPELSKQEIQNRVVELMLAMGLQEQQKNRYPHEFSGGQCQRIGIARAMILNPKLLICDEPVSALDVSIQAQIINLLMNLKSRTGMSMIFISHDLSIVRQVCDRVLVLYKGQVVETGNASDIYENPQHAYTQNLLDSIPLADPAMERKRIG
jgi:oligopeptide transport system ATP-binding protein